MKQSHRPKRKNPKRKRNESVAMLVMVRPHRPSLMVATMETTTAVARRKIRGTKRSNTPMMV
jgi:hypothetical protein